MIGYPSRLQQFLDGIYLWFMWIVSEQSELLYQQYCIDAKVDESFRLFENAFHNDSSDCECCNEQPPNIISDQEILCLCLCNLSDVI